MRFILVFTFCCFFAFGAIGTHTWLNRPAFLASAAPARASVGQPAPRLAITQSELPAKNAREISRRTADNALGRSPKERAPVAAKPAPTPALQGTKNILLVGIDRRPGQKWGGRPDTIVVASLSQETGHLGLISVPRDLYVDIPGHGKDRINASFSVANSRKENPLALLQRVIEDTLLLLIQHTISLDLGGFEELIDAAGGVEVEVPCPIADNFVDTRTESGRRLLHVDAGQQFMDGVTAAMYVRSRHGRSDFGRARRQQAVLFALKRKLSSVENWARIPQILNALDPLVSSDLSGDDELRLAGALTDLEPGHIHGLVLGGGLVSPHHTEDGKAVLLPDSEKIQSALSQLFSEKTPGTRPANVGCPRADVALLPRKGLSENASEVLPQVALETTDETL